ncbi:ATP-binding protein [uncultured Polaribacter sp.]|uniref:tetratricopeptide repeat-containing sensor histidine kinase n=1 Tax=uncultured Polaribacter sp. TaxID=174711 RepID=UPI003704C850
MTIDELFQRATYFLFNKKNILFLLLFVNLSVFSQNESRDTIALILKEYVKTKQAHLPQKAFLIAEKTKIDSVIKQTYILFGMKSFFNKDLANLTLTEKKLRTFFIKTKDSFALGKQYYYKALFFKVLNSGDNLAKADSSLYYLSESKSISLQLKDSLEAGRRLLSISSLQHREKDFFGCESSIIEGLRLLEPLGEVFFTGLLYERLGNVMFRLERQEEARKNYLKFFELQKKIPNIKLKYEKVRLQLHLAKTYEAEGNYTKSIEYFNKCLLVANLKIEHTYRYEAALEGFSYGHFMLGNKKLALKGYLEVLKSRQSRGYKRGLIWSYAVLGQLHASNNETKRAIFFIKKSLQTAKELLTTTKKSENLLLLSKLVRGEKGRKYLEERTQLNDSLYKRERILKNKFTKVRYETEKKDKENIALKLENTRKQLALETERQHKIIGFLSAGASILFLGFGASIVTNRRKKLVFEAKMKQIEVREKERQRIAKSLHDEVAGDIRMLHLELTKRKQLEEAKKLAIIKGTVRNLSHQLSSESFEKVSFKNQIINLVSDFFEIDFKIKVQEIDAVNWKDVNNSIKRILFLVIRESIQNSKTHAVASEVILNFKQTKKALTLTVSDNGKGFNTASKKAGIGLKNMQERIEEVNGTFSIESTLDKGTRIYIEISTNGR